MAEVTLRPVTPALRRACENLEVADYQHDFIATNAQSLMQAEHSGTRFPFAVYDVAARGWDDPREPLIGFAMLELTAGVGFIERLMIDRGYQGRGYGRALLDALIRRLRMTPDAEVIATSHRRANAAAAVLFSGRGFIEWDIAFAAGNPDEVYLVLPST